MIGEDSQMDGYQRLWLCAAKQDLDSVRISEYRLVNEKNDFK
jgi:hypothetical protein